MNKDTPSGWTFQGKYGPSAINLRIGHDLDAEDVVRWDQAKVSSSGIRLRDVLKDYGLPGLPVEIRVRYGLEDDFRRLQAWRGRMSGLWRRVRKAGRDAEIRRLCPTGERHAGRCRLVPRVCRPGTLHRTPDDRAVSVQVWAADSVCGNYTAE